VRGLVYRDRGSRCQRAAAARLFGRMTAQIKASGIHADGVRWFTRTQAARYLGITLGGVKSAQARGGLASHTIEGVSCFTRATLDLYRESTPSGALAARAFGMFDAGASAADVVIALAVQPATAQALLAAFAACSGACVVACPTMGRAAWASLYELPAITPALLLRALELSAQSPSLRPRLLASLPVQGS